MKTVEELIEEFQMAVKGKDVRDAFVACVRRCVDEANRHIDIDDIKETFETKNKANPEEFEDGAINGSGVIQYYEQYRTTGYIKRTGDFVYYGRITSGGYLSRSDSVSLSEFDAARKFIKRTNNPGYPFALSGNCEFVRVTFSSADRAEMVAFEDFDAIEEYKHEVSAVDKVARAYTNRKAATVSLSAGEILIRYHNSEYKIKFVDDAANNLRTWRLYEGNLISDGTRHQMWWKSDAEGAVRIEGDDGFTAGFHGNELMESAELRIDGVETPVEKMEKEFRTLSLHVKSIVYHNRENMRDVPAFERNKTILFDENGNVRVSNHFKVCHQMTMKAARLALFQCDYKDGQKKVLDAFTVNSDGEMYRMDTITDEHPTASASMTAAALYTAGGMIDFRLLSSSSQDYMGSVAWSFAETQNRIKIYLDAIRDGGNVAVMAGEVLSSEFEFKVH